MPIFCERCGGSISAYRKCHCIFPGRLWMNGDKKKEARPWVEEPLVPNIAEKFSIFQKGDEENAIRSGCDYPYCSLNCASCRWCYSCHKRGIANQTGVLEYPQGPILFFSNSYLHLVLVLGIHQPCKHVSRVNSWVITHWLRCCAHKRKTFVSPNTDLAQILKQI